MKALVTGSTGCLGSNICKHLLAQGIEVRALLRPTSRTTAIDDLKVERVLGDVTDVSSLMTAMSGCDWVFHTAALVSYSPKQWDTTRRTTVEGTRHVVEAALKTGVKRLVHTSSIATIGTTNDPSRLPDETWPFDAYKWEIPYHATKLQAEDEIQAGIRQGLDAVICNPSIIFGERDVNMNAAKVFTLIKSLSPFYPGAGGSGICDADDAAVAHIQAARQGRSGERYILINENLTAREYFTLAAQVSGVKQPTIPLVYPTLHWLFGLVSFFTEKFTDKVSSVSPNMPFMVKPYIYGSAEKARRELGYGNTPAHESMEKEYRWLKQHQKL
jgi:dihydroflavonol-4-reductase